MKLLLNITKLILIITLVHGSILSAHVDPLKALESSTEGRLGVFAINTKNGHIVKYRANETFPTGCTSKVMGVSAVLKKSMSEPSLLSSKIKFTKEDLASWSPVTEKYISEGMTIKELCAASLVLSDNTAMNLLLKSIGGVQGMNDFAQSIDDLFFRQDNNWPLEAYSGGAGNVKDASTPKAMVESLRKLTLENILDRPQRDLLITWLIDTKTGSERIRSSIPKNWIVGNKTGTGGAYGTTNDLAIIWPLKHEPILIGIYYTSNNKSAIKREDVISSATKYIVEEFIKNDQTLQLN